MMPPRGAWGRRQAGGSGGGALLVRSRRKAVQPGPRTVPAKAPSPTVPVRSTVTKPGGRSSQSAAVRRTAPLAGSQLPAIVKQPSGTAGLEASAAKWNSASRRPSDAIAT
jgi:hypothetical protein